MFFNCRASLVFWASLIFISGCAVYPLRSAGVWTGSFAMGTLPAFAHTFFFVVILAQIGGMTPRIAGLSILLIAVPLEGSQALSVDWIWPLPDRIKEYAVQGTFDWADVLATAFGAASAMGLCQRAKIQSE